MSGKECLYIKNFAGIKELELEIKPINILIGPQGTGKSVVVKLIYFFKDIINTVVFGNTEWGDVDGVKKEIIVQFYHIFEESVFKTNGSTEIKYVGKDGLEYTIKGNKTNRFEMHFSALFLDILQKVADSKKNIAQINFENIKETIEIRRDFRREIKNVVENEYRIKGVSQIFIPAGRSFFSTIDSNIYSILGDEQNNLDYFLVEFGQLYRSLRSFLFSEVFDKDRTDEGKRIFESVLGGKVEMNDKKLYIVHGDKRKVELKNTSSGQQEALPMLMILKEICGKGILQTGAVLYIEEPEAHLFPTAQKSIVDLLAMVYNSDSVNNQIFITTHSPYVLTSFNNLIYAGNVAKQSEEKKQKIEKLIEADRLLNFENVSAYGLQDGELINLMDKDNNIINARLLDEISNTIGKEFDQLLDIEFDSHDEEAK